MFKETMRPKTIQGLFLLSLLLMVFSCACVLLNSKNSENNNAGEKTMLPVNRNIDDLVKILNLKLRPIEVIWVEEKLGNANNTIPGPSDYKLTAVLKFNQADSNSVIEAAEKIEKSRLGTTEIEPWFPDELKEKGATEIECIRFNAENFVNTPYSSGTLFHLKNKNTFILRLQTF
jgi:hypothetical protein